MGDHGIDWLNQPGYKGETWSLVIGCTQDYAGCQNCWAARLASGRRKHRPRYKGLAVDGTWTGEVRCHEDLLDKPLHWRKPRCIFVCPTGDFFHRKVTFDFRVCALETMRITEQHRYIILTKRPEIAAEIPHGMPHWPLSNVWLYYSASTQADLNEGLSSLLACRAAVRGLSLEPLLEPLDLDLEGIDHVIVGGESGAGARMFDAIWLAEIRTQCRQARVPLYVKQFGANPYNLGGPLKLNDRKGADPLEWPKGARIREFPIIQGV